MLRRLYLLAFIGLTACGSSATNATTDAATTTSDAVSSADALDALDAGETAPETSGSSCSAALASLLGPQDSVSTGAVTVLSSAGGVLHVFIDATAGGFGADATHPRVYVDLATGKRVDVTDKAAATSTAWDLAFKRPVVFSNDGDGGKGGGGVLEVAKSFDSVTSADATGTFMTESFVDADCNAKVDATGAVQTTMSDWYTYDSATNHLKPKANTTYIVRGGTGKLYKVAFLDYYATASGGSGGASGSFQIEVAPL